MDVEPDLVAAPRTARDAAGFSYTSLRRLTSGDALANRRISRHVLVMFRHSDHHSTMRRRSASPSAARAAPTASADEERPARDIAADRIAGGAVVLDARVEAERRRGRGAEIGRAHV
jgi:hypothetical protein